MLKTKLLFLVNISAHLNHCVLGRESGIHVVFNAPENSKTERGGLNIVDPEK